MESEVMTIPSCQAEPAAWAVRERLSGGGDGAPLDAVLVAGVPVASLRVAHATLLKGADCRP